MTTTTRLKMSRFAEASGVPIPTIKHYVRAGLLPAPHRTSKTMAYYDAALVPRVKAIKRLQETLHLPLAVIGQVLDRIDDEEMPNERAIEVTIARVLGELAPRETVTRKQLIANGVDKRELALFESLQIVTPQKQGREVTYVGDDVVLLRLLAESRRAGLSPSMLPPEILSSYVAALRELVRVELQMFRVGVVPLAGGDIGRLTEVATTLSERLVVLLRRKLLLPTLRTLMVLVVMILPLACGDDPSTTDGGGTSTNASADDDDTSTPTSPTSPTGPDETADDADPSGTSQAATTEGDEAPGSTDATADATTSDATTGDDERMGPDFREPGPHVVDTTPGSADLPGCAMDYDVFTPRDRPDAPTVVLAHGFMGTRASMAGWAEHYASWGLRVVTPNLCHATFFDPDHAQNGIDLVALASALELATPTYAGYSAGGLAAVLAAANDAGTLALFGLDMVDNAGLGLAAADGLAVPAADLLAEPAMCNSSGNGDDVFTAMADAHRLRVVEADHCDYQNPPDAFCGTCSAPNDAQTPEDIRATILGLSTAFLVWRTGVDDTGSQWWTPGSSWYATLADAGQIAVP